MMMGQVSEEQRNGLVRAVSFLFNKDFDKLAGSFSELGFVGDDPEALKGFGKALEVRREGRWGNEAG